MTEPAVFRDALGAELKPGDVIAVSSNDLMFGTVKEIRVPKEKYRPVALMWTRFSVVRYIRLLQDHTATEEVMVNHERVHRLVRAQRVVRLEGKSAFEIAEVLGVRRF